MINSATDETVPLLECLTASQINRTAHADEQSGQYGRNR